VPPQCINAVCDDVDCSGGQGLGACSILAARRVVGSGCVLNFHHLLHIRDNALFEVGTASASDHSKSIGITLAGVKLLRDEMQRYNRKNPSSPITETRDIANKIVKSATLKLPKGRQAYVFLNDSLHRGVSQCFVSHTWHANALGLLESVIIHGDKVVAKGGSPPVYYIDLACVDQHKTDQVRLPH
jgi:hypothetical protein